MGASQKYTYATLRQHFNPMMAFIAIFGTFGSMTFAYDGGWWGNALGQPAFTKYYGTVHNANGTWSLSPTQQSCGTALGTAGIMIGCIISALVGKRLGRKRSLNLVSILACIGSVIQITSVIGDRSGPTKFWQLVAGKIIVNSSVGLAVTVVPPYLAECSPAPIRGFMVTCHNIAEVVGGILANATIYGMQGRMSRIVWMLPIGLQMVIPIAMVIGSPFLPESPRWLVEVGRVSEAVKSVELLRRQGPEQAEEEVSQIQEAIRIHEETVGGTNWVDLFRGRNKRRTMITTAMTCFQQGMGISMVNNYFVVTLISIGIASPIQFSFGLAVMQFVLMLSVGSYVPDRFGRRPLLLLGAVVEGSALLVVGSISAATQNHPPPVLQRVYIAMFFLWTAGTAVSWSPLSWAVMAETPSAALREKSMGLGAWSGFAVGMIVNFTQPYMNAAIGGRTAFIYASFAVPAFLFTYFLIPELKGRSLEEVDEIFDKQVPARQSAKYVCTSVAAQHDEASDEIVKNVGDDEEKQFEYTRERV